jgi:hypothetical protein
MHEAFNYWHLGWFLYFFGLFFTILYVAANRKQYKHAAFLLTAAILLFWPIALVVKLAFIIFTHNDGGPRARY